MTTDISRGILAAFSLSRIAKRSYPPQLLVYLHAVSAAAAGGWVSAHARVKQVFVERVYALSVHSA